MDNSTTSGGPPLGAGPPLPPPDQYKVETSVFGFAISMTILSAIAVIARFYTRGIIRKVIGAEDYCILVAFLLTIGAGVAVMMEAQYGLGHQVMELSPVTLMLQLRSAWVFTLFYQLSLAFSKVSVCLLYIRIFNYHVARIAAWLVLTAVVMYNIAGVVSTFTLCIPLEAWWDFTITDKTCHGGPAGMWAFICLHIITDFLIFALPIPVVWMMKLAMKQKICVLFVFALGFFVCLISILRAIFVHVAMAETNPNPPTYIAITNWSVVEVNMGVIIPCLIVLKPLISKIWPAFGSGTRDSKSAGNAAPANVLTIGGSGQPHGDASFQQVSIQSNGAFSVTPSGTEKSLYDIESTAGTSEGGTPMKSKAGEVESVESVNSLHHKFLVDEARESKRHSTIVELA